MGATCTFADGVLTVNAPRLVGADIRFSFPSVGATENLVTAAVCADGVTTIDGAAREPEVADLCRFLVAMGAHIEGIGESTLRITGVPHGHCTRSHIASFQIEFKRQPILHRWRSLAAKST